MVPVIEGFHFRYEKNFLNMQKVHPKKIYRRPNIYLIVLIYCETWEILTLEYMKYGFYEITYGAEIVYLHVVYNDILW